MGEEYSRSELIPPYISSCRDCHILVKDPDLMSVLQKSKKEKRGGVWFVLLAIHIFYFGLLVARG